MGLALIGVATLFVIGVAWSAYVVSRCERVRILSGREAHTVLFLGFYAYFQVIGWASRALLGLGYVTPQEGLALTLLVSPGHAVGVLVSETRMGRAIWARTGRPSGRVWRTIAYTTRPSSAAP